MAVAILNIKLFLAGHNTYPNGIATAVSVSNLRLKAYLLVNEKFFDESEERRAFKSQKDRFKIRRKDGTAVSVMDPAHYPYGFTGGYLIPWGLFTDMDEREGKLVLLDEWALFATQGDLQVRAVGWHRHQDHFLWYPIWSSQSNG